MIDPIPIQFPPGIVRNGTAAQAAGRWYDGHLVRWVEGLLQPFKGWDQLDLPPFPSPIRATWSWTANDGSRRYAFLCETKLYVMEGPTLRDITPVDGITPPSDSLEAGGYGDGTYSFDTYGTPRPERTIERVVGHVWKLRNWGEDLIAMASSDGRLLRWSPSGLPTSVAVAVTGAPTQNRTFEITAERHCMLFGMDGAQNKFGWCSQEDIEDWDFADPLNTAGFYDVHPADRIVESAVTRFGVIFFTVKNVFFTRYRGLPYIYTYEIIAETNAPLAPAAAVTYADNVAWPADDGFWFFDGATVRPLDCPIWPWFRERVDERMMRYRMAGVFNGNRSEVMWFFPLEGEQENSHYMLWNFDEEWWSFGRLARTCGSPGSALTYPLMATTERVYLHEKGNFYPGSSELPWIKTGALSLQKGVRRATAGALIADVDAALPDVLFELEARTGRNRGATVRKMGPKPARERGIVNFRVTGRDFQLTMRSARDGVEPWTFGEGLLTLKPRGKRD